MVDSLRNEHNATGRPQNQCPLGLQQNSVLAMFAPRHRSPSYDLRRTLGDHRNFANNAVHEGFN
ncbi:MAG: hypothetical protein ABL860_06305 [Candidatus Nitrotoga sp.]